MEWQIAHGLIQGNIALLLQSRLPAHIVEVLITQQISVEKLNDCS